MIIRAIKFRAVTNNGDFGFAFVFERNLTIVRASNSSGKSTLYNCLLYALGMEEIIGFKGEKALQSAVKEYFEYQGERVNVISSEVLLELENTQGEIVTVRRAIRDSVRDSKLMEVFSSAHLTRNQDRGVPIPTYVHDPGSAKKQEGFHRFLESFMGLHLPQVATTNGGETKLYLQTIFAALAVEQKRGWTDYIATIPFYGIRDARTRVVEYLLGLSVFEVNAKRNQLNSKSVEIDAEWRKSFDELCNEGLALGLAIKGVPAKPTAQLDPDNVLITRLLENTSATIPEYISQLRAEHQRLAAQSSQISSINAVSELDVKASELQRLSVIYERAKSSLEMQKSSLKEYETLLSGAMEDLERNRTASKLRDLGARHEIELSTGHCPTCHQTIEDTLLSESITGPQMDIAMNIGYLESQSRMLERQIAGFRDGIKQSEVSATQLSVRLAEKHDYVKAMRGDLNTGALESKAVVRRQVQIEIEVEALERFDRRANASIERFIKIATEFNSNQLALKALPNNVYTSDDKTRIDIFHKRFRANAGSFGYESAPVEDIGISPDTLVPCLNQVELRVRTDIKSDSSASDFVRLIWSYLLALHQTSAYRYMPGNHPGILLFDEPGQHSMAVDSQRALLKQLSSESALQSIVAASFDESEDVFLNATHNIPFKLIQWEGKLIRPL
jgi:hypothetical protein